MSRMRATSCGAARSAASLVANSSTSRRAGGVSWAATSLLGSAEVRESLPEHGKNLGRIALDQRARHRDPAAEQPLAGLVGGKPWPPRQRAHDTLGHQLGSGGALGG